MMQPTIGPQPSSRPGGEPLTPAQSPMAVGPATPLENQTRLTTNPSAADLPPGPLPKTEWNFDPVPAAEIIACCWWEYARESAFIRDVHRRCSACSQPPGAPGNGLSCEAELRLHQDLQKAQSIGSAADIFLRGLSSAPPPLAAGEIPAMTGSFPQPWQTLAAAERQQRSHFGLEGKRIPFVPFQRGRVGDAKCISDGTKTPAAKAEPGREPVRREATALLIDWSDVTNDELVNCFRRWVKANRPPQHPVPSQKGHKLVDWRTNLTRLAVLRLLARFTARQLLVENAFPEIWQTQQFAGRKWDDVTKWYNARREARSVFQKLFPFLPPGELPLAWQRHYPANTTVFPG